jgi:DNA mismatch endonuclease (patch repair protein)
MASISGKETKPEIDVRRALFRNGFRYRKNVKTMIGKPDIVLPKYKTAIFIHGCFWHGHNCSKASRPATNRDFWNLKISGNIQRDKIVQRALQKAGWQVITIWECNLKNKLTFEKTVQGLINRLLKIK